MSAPRSRRRGAPPRRYPVASIDEIPPGARKIVTVEGRSIGVFNVEGEFHALRNLCPHQQAPLCEGRLLSTTLPSRPGEYVLGRHGQILRCPWHGWEFDLLTGRSLFDPAGCRVRSYPVSVGSDADAAEPPSVERYPVTVEDRSVFVHL